MNKEFLCKQQMVLHTLIPTIIFNCPFLKAMDDDDAALVSNGWWSNGHTARPYVRGLTEELDNLGIPRPAKKSGSLRAILIHLGNRLVKDGVVTVKKRAGLTVHDIVL